MGIVQSEVYRYSTLNCAHGKERSALAKCRIPKAKKLLKNTQRLISRAVMPSGVTGALGTLSYMFAVLQNDCAA